LKKYWRCHVCNDIHWGLAPPDLCPTCKVQNAYVEIFSGEARTILPSSDETMSRNAFLLAIERFAEDNEFMVNPDKEGVDTLLEGIFNNEKNHGLKYCPCRLATKEFSEDLKLVCPCNFRIHETYKDQDNGECWCGLFIKRKKHE